MGGDEIGNVITGKTPSTKNQSLWNGELLFITPTDISDKNKYQTVTQRTVKKTDKIKTLPIGSIVYTCIASIGKIALTTSNSVTNQQINSIVPFKSFNNEFVFYALINLTTWIKSIPATSTLPIINKSEFSKIKIKVPKNPKEQQKIANCLSSLDNLIAAETEKLEILKEYKKGLLQQLFPAKGKTKPQIRFPEFKNDGDWERKGLGNEDVSKIVMGSSPKSSFYNKHNFGLPLLQGNADIIDRLSSPRIFTSQVTKECQIDDILLSVRPPVGTVAKSIHKACIGRGIAAIQAYKNSSQEFLYQWLISFEPYWKNISQGGTFDAVNSDDIRKLSIPIPKPPEQQKIANCLSSLDNLIAAETEKLEILKAHKKGLMQQLFPNVNDLAV